METNKSKPDAKKTYCSFCGKSEDEVKVIIAGPSVFICNECTSLCNDILDDVKTKNIEDIIPTPEEIQDEIVSNGEELISEYLATYLKEISVMMNVAFVKKRKLAFYFMVEDKLQNKITDPQERSLINNKLLDKILDILKGKGYNADPSCDSIRLNAGVTPPPFIAEVAISMPLGAPIEEFCLADESIDRLTSTVTSLDTV
jgi:hypothetical protein